MGSRSLSGSERIIMMIIISRRAPAPRARPTIKDHLHDVDRAVRTPMVFVPERRTDTQAAILHVAEHHLNQQHSVVPHVCRHVARTHEITSHAHTATSHAHTKSRRTYTPPPSGLYPWRSGRWSQVKGWPCHRSTVPGPYQPSKPSAAGREVHSRQIRHRLRW